MAGAAARRLVAGVHVEDVVLARACELADAGDDLRLRDAERVGGGDDVDQGLDRCGRLVGRDDVGEEEAEAVEQVGAAALEIAEHRIEKRLPPGQILKHAGRRRVGEDRLEDRNELAFGGRPELVRHGVVFDALEVDIAERALHGEPRRHHVEALEQEIEQA